ncbi:retinoic acid receptor responder protein 3 isoform X1 [Silurus asotus]|uniref:Retinoic acid receptor responder protein 3 isoform X1 n=1 Tax=Silurus asotus TaxID=30991 RepID=A0AAD5ANF0_SILAS|nr:retinoic acid receptor responder protein 3 isoform X1 [Silurus asotus]
MVPAPQLTVEFVILVAAGSQIGIPSMAEAGNRRAQGNVNGEANTSWPLRNIRPLAQKSPIYNPMLTHKVLTIKRDSETKFLLFGRALNAAVKLDPLDVVGKKYKVNNYLDEKHPPRDFYSHIKSEIEEAMTKTFTYDILFHNSEHQATLLRYGIKKSEQIDKVYAKIVQTWREPFEKKKF